MRLASWVVQQPGKDMVLQQREEAPGTCDVIVKVAGCGVCHTDLGFFYDGVPTRHAFPLTLGHEISGTVVEAGTDASEWLGAAAGIPAATVYLYPNGLTDYRAALPILAMVLVPAILMVSTIRFRSFKTIDLQVRRSYTVLLLIAAGLMLIATHPRIVLVVIAYSYLASAFVEMAIARLRHRGNTAADTPAVDDARFDPSP